MVHEGILKIGSLGLQHGCLTEEAASVPQQEHMTENHQGQKLGKLTGNLKPTKEQQHVGT